MKRGLVVLNDEETSRAAFAARIDGVRKSLKDSGARLALIYGDVSRSGDINYLTNLCLYWNEAVLAVPAEGAPALITKLSKRVQPWMLQTSILEDIRSGPRLAENIGKFLDERGGGRTGNIAVLDMSWWPNNLVEQLRKTVPEAELRDLPGAVRARRLVPSAEEQRFLALGCSLLDEALTMAWAEGRDPHERTSIAVRSIRRAGFQDATVTCGRLPDGSEYADAIGQFRYVWLRQSRPRGGETAQAAQALLRAALLAAKPGVTEARLVNLVAGQVDARYKATLSCIPHPDIETRGLFRSRADGERPLKNGEVVCIALSLANDGGVVTAAETVQITRSGAAPLHRKENT